MLEITRGVLIPGLPEVMILVFFGFFIFFPALMIWYLWKKKFNSKKIDELEKLHKLRKEGAITEEEYQRLKMKLSI